MTGVGIFIIIVAIFALYLFVVFIPVRHWIAAIFADVHISMFSERYTSGVNDDEFSSSFPGIQNLAINYMISFLWIVCPHNYAVGIFDVRLIRTTQCHHLCHRQRKIAHIAGTKTRGSAIDVAKSPG